MFACLDDIRFLEAGLSGCVLYQQIRCKVEKFLCPFLQKVKFNCLLLLFFFFFGLRVIALNIYLGYFLLEGHEVQIGDVDHVRSSHHRQHPVLHLPRQGADIQQLPQLGFLRAKQRQKKEADQTYNSKTTEVPTPEELGYSFEMQMTMSWH